MSRQRIGSAAIWTQLALGCMIGSGWAQTVTATPPTAKTPLVILIHGRDQPSGKEAEIAKLWKDSLKAGLKGITSGEGCSYLNGDGRNNGDSVSNFTSELRDLFLGVAHQLPDEASRTVVNAMAHDTGVYLGNGKVACGVDTAFVKTFFDSIQSTDTFIVVAHSMESMVAYKNLINKLSFLPIHVYLLTFGSMLPEPEVPRALLGSLTAIPPPVPLPVGWRRNVMNRGDLLAFPSARAFSTDHPEKVPKDIPINTPRINGRDAASYYVSRHDAGAYLRDPSTAKAIREAWCAVATLSADCKKLGVGH